MDPDRKWTSTRATLLATPGQNCWPPAGTYMAATGQDLMAADRAVAGTPADSRGKPHRWRVDACAWRRPVEWWAVRLRLAGTSVVRCLLHGHPDRRRYLDAVSVLCVRHLRVVAAAALAFSGACATALSVR